MATILSKDLVRESTIKVNDKSIMATICADQSIELKLKGERGGTLKISLLELYEYLGGGVVSKDEKDEVKAIPVQKSKANEKMVSLYDLRSMSVLETSLSHAERAKFDGIISELIKSYK